MRRTLTLSMAIVAGSAIVAAPLPKELTGTKLERFFGKPFDPSNACEFSLDGTNLRVTIPGTVEAAATHLKGSPRTSREVTGDFTAEAVVSYAPPKNEDGTAGGHFGAGVVAWVDDETYAFINRHHWPAGAGWAGGFDTHIHLPEVPPHSHGEGRPGITAETPARLRLTRKGNQFTTAESQDGGKTWNETGKVEGKMPATLQVGVVGFNTTKMKVELIFESFDVKQK